MTSLLSFAAAAALLVSAPALAKNERAVCEVFAAHDNCQFSDSSLVLFELAKKELQEEYAEKQWMSPQSLRCFMTAYNVLLTCVHAETCKDYVLNKTHDLTPPSVRKSLGSGWSVSYAFSFKGTPGNCAMDFEKTFSTGSLQPPGNGQAVASENTVYKDNKETHWSLILSKQPQCKGDRGSAGRLFSVRANGVLAQDVYKKGAPTWVRHVEATPPGKPALKGTDPQTLRIEWPGGATLDLGSDGFFKSSNFLTSQGWSPGECRSEGNAPAIVLRPDAPGMRVVAEPIKAK